MRTFSSEFLSNQDYHGSYVPKSERVSLSRVHPELLEIAAEDKILFCK
jgi:hypothetical protein